MHVCCLNFNKVLVSVYRLSSLEVDPQWSWHQIWLAENVHMGVVRIKCASTPCRRAINSRSAVRVRKRTNNSGPNTEPCGTPFSAVRAGDLTYNTCSEIQNKLRERADNR